MRLAADLRAGELVDQPANTVDRYITNTQGETTLTLTAPDDNTAVAGSPLTVSGTTEAGNQVDVLVSNTDANMAASAASTVAGPDGSFTVDVPITGGVQVVNVAATRADGATAHATRTVVFDFVPGTVLLDVADPDGDDNGPGNYAYATFGDFKPGAWDMQRFQVFDDGTNIIFRVQNRDQSATFGSPLGAQLIDVYVHDPAAATDVDCAVAPVPQLPDRRGLGVEHVDPGARFRPAVRERVRHDAGHGQHPRQRTVAVHHVQRAEGRARPTGPGLDVHRRRDRPGRLQPRPGTRVPGDTAGLPVRSLCRGQRRSALHRRPRHGAEGDRRADPGRRAAIRRARLHRPLAGDHHRRPHHLIRGT